SPLIKRAKIEPISTGYVLIESGVTTTAVYMSGSLPVPRNKPEIAAATALAGEYLGMKFIYLEAGSGAQESQESVPDEMVKAVSEECSIPIIVGGGIRNPQTARRKVDNGASIIVTGNFFEDENNWDLIKDFASAIHKKLPVEV
ncbi:MAG: HisA/HisF-related TIM barrel protein, partial [Ignavibacteriaceae bacterium]|nr:HisA/HisF-related TIM barrel protein [Ignavibacteriaceae bacterium]